MTLVDQQIITLVLLQTPVLAVLQVATVEVPQIIVEALVSLTGGKNQLSPMIIPFADID
jgi:hypothetical protein